MFHQVIKNINRIGLWLHTGDTANMDESSGDIKIITEYGLVFKEGISREIYEKLKGDEKFNKMFKKVDYIYVNDEPLAIMIIDG